MKILIVVPSLTRAGAETQAVDLANGFSSMGHEAHLCSFERQLDQRDRISEGVKFHHVLRKSKYDFSLPGALAEIIDREQIEIVQGVGNFATFIATLATRRVSRKPPVVAAVHTTINRGLKQELQDRILYRYMLRRRPAVVFVCVHQHEHWMRKYPELGRQARVVHNGVALSRFRREDFVAAAGALRRDLQIPPEAFVFSCLAAFRPEKGHDLLIQAFAQTPAETVLLLAGDGQRRARIEAAVRNAGLVERVRFLGNVQDVRPVVVASDATVLASTAVETFSMAMLESMALGVAMIAPRIGGLPEAIVPRETGLLFRVGDVAEMASGMKSMVADKTWTRAMGQAAHERVAERFTLESMLQRSEQVLREVLADDPAQ